MILLLIPFLYTIFNSINDHGTYYRKSTNKEQDRTKTADKIYKTIQIADIEIKPSDIHHADITKDQTNGK